METFLLGMTLYPDVQRKAQAELDRVIGPDRLPSFEDRDSLPYIAALVSEVYRWIQATPLSSFFSSSSRMSMTDYLFTCFNLVVRSTTDDIIFEGYLIPRGTIVNANLWCVDG